MHVLDQRRTKLDDKSKKYVFIKNYEKIKTSKLFDLIEKKVVVSRDVQLNGESAWDWINQIEVTRKEEKGEPSTAALIYTPITPQTSKMSQDNQRCEVCKTCTSQQAKYT